MGLRRDINELGLSKKINYSFYGKKFENSDFAKSAEMTGMLIKLAMREKDWDYKTMGIAGILGFPFAHLATYVFVKREKKKDPLFYTHFIDDLHFVFND